MNKGFKIITVLGFLLATFSSGISLWLYLTANKVGFVDTIRLTNEYQLKKDLESIEERKLSLIKSHVDSLNAIYNIAKSSPGTDPSRIKAMEFQIKQVSDLFQNAYTRSSQEISEKVWTRLNADIQQYAKKHDMRLLIGANGMGTVLYGSTTIDYTNNLIDFVNEKYQHGN